MKTFAAAIMALVSMSACNNEADNQASVMSKGEAVKFQMELATTRTTTGTDYVTEFVTGDAVGVFAYERSSDGSNGAIAVSNAKYVLQSDGSWVAEDTDNAAYADASVEFNYYAYYPYQSSVDTPTAVALAVSTDQSAVDNYNSSDALTAQNKEVAAGTTSVSLTFKHAFAMVQVNLAGSEASKDAVITMQNVYPETTVNPQDGTTTSASGTIGTVKMYSLSEVNQVENASRFVFRAIVPAQEIAAGTNLLEIQSNGKTYIFTYSTAVSYVAGAVRIMNVSLGETAEKTSISIVKSNTTIDTWGTTESGDGSGTVVEKLLIDEFEAGDFDTTYANGNALTTTEDTWFAIKSTSASYSSVTENGSFTISDITDAGTFSWTKQASVTLSTTTSQNNSWYIMAIAYMHVTPIDVTTTSIYKLSFKAKIETELTKSVQVCCINSDETNKFAISATTSFTAGTLVGRTNTGNDWETQTVYIQFAKVGSGTGSPSGSATLSDSTSSSDYEKISIRFIPNPGKADGTTTVHITDVVLEPYTE